MGGAPSTPLTGEASFRGEGAEHDLDVFDRSTLAQVKTGHLHTNYEILEELGSGSFGVVNRARDIRTKGIVKADYVAVKTIPKKKVSDPQKIKAEFNVLRQLDHAHICKAYECYEDRRNIYLVMDICSGGTLLEALCKRRKFTETDAANVMRQILSALAYLHQSNFVFRDLKTENIMFAKPVQQGEVGNVKLIDFGLCCPFERGTKIMKAAGTPYSVAPELVTAPVQYDQKCDAWSAGVVMYIILSGQYPFRAKTKDALLQQIRREPVSFKDKAWKKISKDAKTLLAELLRKKAEVRCEVIEALDHPWLQLNAVLPEENIMQDVVQSMTHFQTLNMLQKAAITALAWRATDEDTVHLRQIFESLDRDGNGHITVAELRNAFEKAGVEIPGDLSMLDVGTDGNDTIEYTEFIAAAMDKKKIVKEEVVWEAFKIFDQDGSGTVTKKELLKILTGRTSDKIRQVHGDKAIENFLGEYDVSGDAVIDFDEFMGMLSAASQTYTAKSCHKGRRASTVKGGVSGIGEGLIGWFQTPTWCHCTSLLQAKPEEAQRRSTSVRETPEKSMSMRRASSRRHRSKSRR
mmetsp:Transcript_98016/g.272772  ORF Transcript_98016/g.272772 Transcript_98016/m.272772 type:complete len:577 (-) Transcript_98016:272-2002(-)|eukprot:CAMPEP_0179128770 /NCGR_PEP_ID=MMETSP0796-20121207/61069_1 /TAXON_ID=73915 /ORGANISM="Pyrodinium bahamense, Strain pbaha01" /LENGTH=576 /DNA_ID=CAMNT_0020827627 /DNA_START=61 /DNA_END=1791 /DNA_ORIENTATION=+